MASMKNNNMPSNSSTLKNASSASNANPAEGYKFCPYDGYKFTALDNHCLVCKRAKDSHMGGIASDGFKKSPKKWRKILYQQQGIDDNYYDASFLSSLVQKNDRSHIQLKEVMEKTLDVTWSVNGVVTFLLIFYSMKEALVYEGVLTSGLSLFCMLCVFLYILFTRHIIETKVIFNNIKKTLILLCTLYLLSPIMKTVNETYADNTTYALSIGLILFHMIFKDYSSKHHASPKKWKCDTPTFAAYAFSSFLASRLSNDFQVFTLLFSCLIFFFFSEFFKYAIKDYSTMLFKSWNIAHTVLVFIMIFSISKLLAFVYLISQVFITLICPMWLIWLYQYKRTFHGPWDLPELKNKYQ